MNNSDKSKWDKPNRANLHTVSDYPSFEVSHDKIGSNGNGGGSNMDRYATKEELRTLEAKIDGRFNVIDKALEDLPDKIDLKIKDSEEKQRKETIENRRYIWGTLIIGIVSIVVSLLN